MKIYFDLYRMLKRFFKNIDKRQAISWALYDFANSSYTVIIAWFVFPIYFKEFVAGGATGDFWRGLAVSVSVLLWALSSPIIWAIADHDQRRKYRFIMFAILSMLWSSLLYFVWPWQLAWGLFVFIMANLCFEIAQILYDSFIGQVSSPQTAGRISGLGYGLWYLGGLVAMLLLQPLYKAGYIAWMETSYMLTFPLTAVFFLIFSLPSFVFLKDKREAKQHIAFHKLVKIWFQKVWATLKSLKKYKNIAWFILGFCLLNDALVTVLSFVPIYAKTTLHFNMSQIVIMVVLVQVIGFPAAIVFGWLSDKIWYRKILLWSILGRILITSFLALGSWMLMMYIVISITGLVIWSSQATIRSWYNKIVPAEKRCEFFGFNGFASKAAATIGPLLFGIISVTTGNQRIAMAAIVPFFILAIIIFYRLRE